jgi:hypothetical protein
VLALADCLDNYRKGFRELHGTDVLHYLTLPKASWSGFLRNTGASIELVTDQYLANMVELGIRGGLCVPFQSHALANDPRTPEYDPSKPASIIVYFDATNLYGWCMTKPLPQRNYQRIEADLDEFLRTKLFDYDEDATTGYIFCLRMHVPPEVHDKVDFAPICKAVIDDTKKLFPYLGEQDYVATLPLLVRYHRLGVVFDGGVLRLQLPSDALHARAPPDAGAHAGHHHAGVREERLQDLRREPLRHDDRKQDAAQVAGAAHRRVLLGGGRGQELAPRPSGLGALHQRGRLLPRLPGAQAAQGRVPRHAAPRRAGDPGLRQVPHARLPLQLHEEDLQAHCSCTRTRTR